jgi:DNA ligase 1
MSAILCRNSAGVEFKIGGGFDLNWREHPPKVGSKVTYKYQNLTNLGKPRFPIFLRMYEGI